MTFPSDIWTAARSARRKIWSWCSTWDTIPLAILYLGRSNATIIFFLVLTVMWPILFSLISTLKMIKSDWEEAVQVAHLPRWHYFTKFLIPASLPGLMTGSVIGLGEGWEALIATEMIVGEKMGLGDFFQTFSTNPAVTAFGIFGLLLLIFSINKLVWLPLLEWGHKQLEE